MSLVVLLVGMTALWALDMRLHTKFDRVAGLNHRGYRGRVLGRKQSGEVRIGLFGGSVAMGYGVKNEQTIATLLERSLNAEEAGAGRPPKYTVANLASNGETGLAFFQANYELFDDLDLDTLIFYVWKDGPDVQEQKFSQRSANPFMRYFGYYWILPTVARERYYLARYGDIEKGYKEDRLFSGLDRPWGNDPNKSTNVTQSLTAFINGVVQSHKTVILALQPGDRADGPDMWADFRRFYTEQFANSKGVIIADLRSAFPTAEWSSHFVDAMHYSEKGNRAVARALTTTYLQHAGR